MRRSALIYNPTSGRHVAERVLPQLLEELRRGGFDTRPVATRAAGDATPLARQQVDAGMEVVFALGGDGTLREVASGLLGSGVALGALPAGTANVLAFELGVPRQCLRAARAYADATIEPFDVGMAGATPFLMMVSGGLDAAVMAAQDSQLKRRFGPAAVASTGIKKWWTYDGPEMELWLDGKPECASFFAVCNIPFFGGPFRLAPDANPQDGRLDVVLFQGKGRWPTAGLLRDLLLGRHLRRGDVFYRQAETVEIVGPLPWGLQVDGDVLATTLPCSIKVMSGRLHVLKPTAK